VVYLGRGSDGKVNYKWHTVRGTKRDAQAELARILNSFNAGTYVEPTRVSLGEYLERWLTDYARPKLKGSTLDRYETIVRKRLIPALGTVQLAKIQPIQLQNFYSEMQREVSNTTVLHYHRVLHKALESAVKWQLLGRNVADAVELPRKRKREFPILTESETARLLAEVQGTWLHTPVLLAVSTGMRRGEILGLKWTDVDLKARRLVVQRSLEQRKSGEVTFKEPKSSRGRRSIPLPMFAVRTLQAHRREQLAKLLELGLASASEGLVCTTEDGSAVPPDRLSGAFRDLIRRSNLPPVRFHDLRHSHATQLLKENVHPKVVSERLGHATVSITLDLYSHVLPSMQEEAAEKFDAAIQTALLVDAAERAAH
jgi:integrase